MMRLDKVELPDDILKVVLTGALDIAGASEIDAPFAADPAEVMACGEGVELVERQGLGTREQRERTLVHPSHQCVLAPADRAVAGGEFGDFGTDGKAHGATVAAARVRLHAACSRAVHTTTRSRPRALAAYRASSARRSKVCRSSPAGPRGATPTDILGESWTAPAVKSASATWARTRSPS